MRAYRNRQDLVCCGVLLLRNDRLLECVLIKYRFKDAVVSNLNNGSVALRSQSVRLPVKYIELR